MMENHAPACMNARAIIARLASATRLSTAMARIAIMLLNVRAVFAIIMSALRRH
jgi:hypothetical protein